MTSIPSNDIEKKFPEIRFHQGFDTYFDFYSSKLTETITHHRMGRNPEAITTIRKLQGSFPFSMQVVKVAMEIEEARMNRETAKLQELSKLAAFYTGRVAHHSPLNPPRPITTARPLATPFPAKPPILPPPASLSEYPDLTPFWAAARKSIIGSSLAKPPMKPFSTEEIMNQVIK